MAETLSMDMVNALEQLLKEKAADWLWKGATVSNVVEKLSVFDHFLTYIGNIDLLAALFVPNRALFTLRVSDNVLVIELTLNFILLFHLVECLYVKVRVIQAKDFKSKLSSILVKGLLNLA